MFKIYITLNSESINLSFEVICLTLIIIMVIVLTMMMTMMMLRFANVFSICFWHFCQVSDSDGKEVPSQVNVWWDHRNRISTAKYEVSIVIPQPKFSNALQGVSAW